MDTREIETPTSQLIAEAIDAGDGARAKKLLHLMVADWERNKDYSINWIAQLLSFIGRRLGEPAVEERCAISGSDSYGRGVAVRSTRASAWKGSRAG